MVDTNKKQEIPQKTIRRPIVTLRRKQMWLTTLLGAAILVSGAGIGLGTAMAYLSGSREIATIDIDDPQPPTDAAVAITRDVAAKCGLDRQQAGKVKDIMSKHVKTLHKIRSKAMDEMMVVHREITADMRGLMNPDQFKRWQKQNEEARNHSRFRHRPWGRGPQRGGDHEGRGKYSGRGGPNGQGKGYPGGMPDMFKRMDKDNNSELTEDEIKQVPGPFQQLLQKADLNGDGKVDRKEYDTQFRRRRPPSSSPGRIRKPYDRPDPSSAPAQNLSMFWL